MVNRQKKVYKPKSMTEGKRNIIYEILQENDSETAENIQDILDAEIDDHLGYEK